jgi:3-dehydroshikimate dehydratase
MPYRLAAFADEISTDIQIQMDHLLDNGVNLCCMRGANAKSVLDFEEYQIPILKTQFLNRGIRFSCIGSPIGKVLITEPFEKEMERLKLACRRAKQFETRVIRVFSFHLPAGDDPAKHRDEVIRRVKAMAAHAHSEGLNLLHENEHDVWGATGARCADLLGSVNAPNLMATFDFANFVAAGEDPLAAWPQLKKWVKDFHIKDAKKGGPVVLAGQGDGHMKEVLSAAFGEKWAGLLTIEPHLDKSPGFEQVPAGKRFKAAVDALKELLKEIGA